MWIWHAGGSCSCNRAFCYFVAHDDYDDDGCLIRYRWAISTWICRYGYADLQIESIVLPATNARAGMNGESNINSDALATSWSWCHDGVRCVWLVLQEVAIGTRSFTKSMAAVSCDSRLSHGYTGTRDSRGPLLPRGGCNAGKIVVIQHFSSCVGRWHSNVPTYLP